MSTSQIELGVMDMDLKTSRSSSSVCQEDLIPFTPGEEVLTFTFLLINIYVDPICYSCLRPASPI